MRLAVVRADARQYADDERHYEDALEALLERDVAISAFAPGPLATRLQLIESKPVPTAGVGAFWRSASFAHNVCEAIAEARADLVVSHALVECCDVYCCDDGVQAARFAAAIHVSDPRSRLRARTSISMLQRLRIEQRLFASRWLRAVVCPSEKIRDELQRTYGVADNKLKVIPHAVDTDVFNRGAQTERTATRGRYGIDAEAVVFLFAGSPYEWHGLPIAMAALAQLPAAAQLIVAGTDSHEARHRRLAQTLGISQRVTFCGAREDVRRLLAAADAFVWPTRYDASPADVFAAMACELPIVTTSASSAAEVALAHDAGLVCAKANAADIALQMQALLDAPTRTRMGGNARSAMLARSRAALTLALVLLYRDLFEQSPKRAKRRAAARADAARDTGNETTRPAADTASPQPSAQPDVPPTESPDGVR